MFYYAIGNALVSEDELLEKVNSGELQEFYNGLSSSTRITRTRSLGSDSGTLKIRRSVSFSTGEVTTRNAIPYRLNDADSESLVPFEPIGIGKPLTIMIREAYTGKYPESGFFEKKKPLLITTAVKNFNDVKAQPHALNILTKVEKNRRRITELSATEQGTQLIYYSPAITVDSKKILLDLYMSFDDFAEDLFKFVGDACQLASTIPLFLPYSTCLLSASVITKLAGNIGEKIFDGTPEFNGHSEKGLNISLPGEPITMQGYRLVTDQDLDKFDQNFRRNYGVDQKTGRVVNASGKEYSGDVPYAVISLDGTQNDALKAFAPTAASAEVLSRFLKAEDKTSFAFDTLIEAMKFYNDYKYRLKVDELDVQLGQMNDDPEAKAKIQKEREAYAKNILNDVMKKK